MTLGIGIAGTALFLVACGMRRFHFIERVAEGLFWVSLTSLGIALVVSLRYIGVPSDEEVEQNF